MKSLGVVSVLVWSIASGITGFAYSSWATANGFHIPVSGISLSISIFLATVILLAMAWPIYRYKRQLKKALEANANQPMAKPLPVDPFYAVKVLLLARATGITAAIFFGWHIGVIIKQLTTTVIVRENVTPNIVAGISSLLLLAAAFIVIEICKLPHDANRDGAVTA
jgi:ABC-type spermidine/putrescine transport system permease subunit II